MNDPYYIRSEVSNSNLTEIKKYFYPDFMPSDPEIHFKFGNLIDFMITEPNKVDFYKRTIDGYQEPFTDEDFNRALEMRKAFMKNHLCAQLMPLAEFQKIVINPVEFQYGGIRFTLPMRCKYDMYMRLLNWGADIKSTASTTLRSFTEACYHFDYDRSRVLYMLLSGSKKDMILGISKKNYKIFNIAIQQGDAIWKSGYEKLCQLAFQYWLYFEHFKIAA